MRLVDFLFEAGLLKNTPRSGWLTIGIERPESVAEHSFRVSLMGMILARLERANETKVMKMCLLHDLEETRLGDLHTVNKVYLQRKRSASEDLLKGLFFEKDATALLRELEQGKTREAVVARDADKLEMVFQAKEYLDLGNKHARDWIKSGMRELKTKSARDIARQAVKRDSRAWLFSIKD